MQIIPRVVDLFHGDVMDTSVACPFEYVAKAGIWGLIHKATQGLGSNDPLYSLRTAQARSAGLLTGAYHFNTGDAIPSQVRHFFDAAKPTANTLMALDFEDNRASQMTVSQAAQFLQLVDEQLGRPCWLYSGNRIKETIIHASLELRTLFSKRHFWLCEYGPTPRMTDADGRLLPWPAPTLWQYTGDGIGPKPHQISGIKSTGIDINSYVGTREQLAIDWVT